MNISPIIFVIFGFSIAFLVYIYFSKITKTLENKNKILKFIIPLVKLPYLYLFSRFWNALFLSPGYEWIYITVEILIFLESIDLLLQIIIGFIGLFKKDKQPKINSINLILLGVIITILTGWFYWVKLRPIYIMRYCTNYATHLACLGENVCDWHELDLLESKCLLEKGFSK